MDALKNQVNFLIQSLDDQTKTQDFGDLESPFSSQLEDQSGHSLGTATDENGQAGTSRDKLGSSLDDDMMKPKQKLFSQSHDNRRTVSASNLHRDQPRHLSATAVKQPRTHAHRHENGLGGRVPLGSMSLDSSALDNSLLNQVERSGAPVARSTQQHKSGVSRLAANSYRKQTIPMESFSEESSSNSHYDTIEVARSGGSAQATSRSSTARSQAQHNSESITPKISDRVVATRPSEQVDVYREPLAQQQKQQHQHRTPSQQQHQQQQQHRTPAEHQQQQQSAETFKTPQAPNQLPVPPQMPTNSIPPLVVNGKSYQVLNSLGKGGSSVVYQVYEPQTQKLMAIKCVDLSDADQRTREAYTNEIHLLQKLQNTDRVVKLYDFEQREEQLIVVMEKGDTDFATFLKSRRNDPLTGKMIAFYWLEMLRAVHVIHKAGIVHSDLKPANFLLVGGTLKLIDFGIAAAVPSNKTSIIKDCQMGTLNYMSPEAIKNASGSHYELMYKVQYKSDVWSLGCMLYMMVYGCTPFQHIRDQMAKMMAICDNNHQIKFAPIDDPLLMDVLKGCLQRDLLRRPSVAQLLEHEYIVNKKPASSNAHTDSPDVAAEQVDDASLLNLAQRMNANTPRTNARVLKRIIEQQQKKAERIREQLNEHEVYFAQLEKNVKTVIRQCATMVEYGKGYVAAFYNMVEAMKELNTSCFANDPSMCSAFGIVVMAFEEIVRLQKVLVEQAHWSLSKRLNEFLAKELSKCNEMRTHLNRVSDSLDDALVRNASTSVSKEAKAKESSTAIDAHNELVAVGTCFSHTALDYVFHLNLLHAKDAPEILDSFLSFIRATKTHFNEGKTFFDEWNRDERYVGDSINEMQVVVKAQERKMQDRHMLVPKDVFESIGGISPEPDVVMEGYLFKRSSNAFKTWNRRWFVIRDNRLMYRTRDPPNGLHELKPMHRKSTDDGYVVMEPELRVCLVRQAPANLDRANCFELVTPHKQHVLQADSPALCRSWMKALQRTIESALHDETPESFDDRGGTSVFDTTTTSGAGNTTLDVKNGSVVGRSSAADLSSLSTGGGSGQASATPGRSPAVKRRVLDELYQVAGNRECADCGQANPKWASINLGVLLCIECAGIHRSLGVQTSKVRSTQLDAWEPEQTRVMQCLGNEAVNRILLKYMPAVPVPPAAKPNTARTGRDAWIRAKYVDRRFARKPKDRATALALAHQHQHHKPASRHNSLLADVLTELDQRKADGCGRDDSPRRCLSVGRLLEPLDDSSNRLARATSNPCLNDSMTSDGNVLAGDKPLASCGSDPLLDQSADTGDAEDELNRSMSDTDRHRQAQRLLRAAAQGNVIEMCAAITNGADVNCRIAMQVAQDGVADRQTTPDHLAVSMTTTEHTTPLHQAIKSGTSEAVEYLLLNNAKLNVVDSDLNTPVHLAVLAGLSGQVCQLVRRGAVVDLKNTAGHTPLDIAVEKANADVVTLLRLSKLREEVIALEPMNNTIEETMSGVLDDISRQANSSRTSSARSADNSAPINA